MKNSLNNVNIILIYTLGRDGSINITKTNKHEIFGKSLVMDNYFVNSILSTLNKNL